MSRPWSSGPHSWPKRPSPRPRTGDRLAPEPRSTCRIDAGMVKADLHRATEATTLDSPAALVGPGASGLSPGVIGRLKSGWEAEHER